MRVLYFFMTVLLSALFLAGCKQETVSPIVTNGLIINAVIYDGTGAKPTRGNIRIKNGLIEDMGNLSPEPGEEIWDVRGLTIAPGFIDPHSHHSEGLLKDPAPASVLAQGITTVVVGVDGKTPRPVSTLFTAFNASPVAVNVASFGGHNSYRARIMGDDFKRYATVSEIKEMVALLEEDMAAGALGLATGLEYEPSLYSTTEEVLALATAASKLKGRYTSHMRSEDINVMAAVDEFLYIARLANIPANISHIKLAMNARWGDAHIVLNKMNAARASGLDITADIYPYQGWQAPMQILLPNRDYGNRSAFEYALSDIAAPETIIITEYDKNTDYIGKTLADIATERSMNPTDLMMEMVGADGSNHIRIIGRNMGSEDLISFLQWPYTSVSSDGAVDDRHPRGQGAFPRILAKYVRDLKVLTLEEAIHKMTGLTARSLGLSKRGTLKAGHAADLIAFDPETIKDHATFQNPVSYSTGVKYVWVNGALVWQNEKPTGLHSGQILRRQNQ